MRYLIVLTLIFVCNSQAWAVDAFFDLKKFNTETNQPYIEIHMMVPGKSVNFAPNEEGLHQAAVEVLILIQQNDTIQEYDKYVLKSKALDKDEYVNLIDMKRFALEQGSYNIEITFADVTDTITQKKLTHTFDLNFAANSINISDITLAEKLEKQEEENIYCKSGYEVIPNVISFFSNSQDKLGFYAEVYGADQVIQGDYIINYSVMNESLSKVEKGLRKFKKATPSAIEPVMGLFNIEYLPSGNYHFLIEIRNKQNELLTSQSIPFQRSKPISLDAPLLVVSADAKVEDSFIANYKNIDTLSILLGSIAPLLGDYNEITISNIIETRDLKMLQKTLYNYLRAIFPENTETEFNLFKNVAFAIESKYSTLSMRGYESDRGRFFLLYGEPTEIITGNEGGAVPFEIWTYNKVKETNESFVKTIFFNPDIASNTFPVLHSEINGELRNEHWKIDLYGHSVFDASSSRGAGDLDITDRTRTVGERAIDIFDEYKFPRNFNNKSTDD